MAQQQQRREQFGVNAPARAQEQQERERDVLNRNELNQESDQWKEEFGTRAGAPNPAAPYGFATGPGGTDDFGVPAGTGLVEETTTTAHATFDDPNATVGTGGGGGGGNIAGNRNRNRDDMNNRNRNRAARDQNQI